MILTVIFMDSRALCDEMWHHENDSEQKLGPWPKDLRQKPQRNCQRRVWVRIPPPPLVSVHVRTPRDASEPLFFQGSSHRHHRIIIRSARISRSVSNHHVPSFRLTGPRRRKGARRTAGRVINGARRPGG